MSELKQAMPWPITMVHYWSDGAASQFKNRYNFLNVAFHQRDFECDADWSFFCTAHGKGPFDGVGGEVKRAVWQQILRGNEVVSNPLDFFNVASKLAKKIKVPWLPLDETSKVVAKLDECFADCAVVCGTQSVHYLKREDDTCIATALNSPLTRDEWLTTHRLMPVEKVAAGVATSPPLQTPPQQHNADI